MNAQILADILTISGRQTDLTKARIGASDTVFWIYLASEVKLSNQQRDELHRLGAHLSPSGLVWEIDT